MYSVSATIAPLVVHLDPPGLVRYHDATNVLLHLEGSPVLEGDCLPGVPDDNESPDLWPDADDPGLARQRVLVNVDIAKESPLLSQLEAGLEAEGVQLERLRGEGRG